MRSGREEWSETDRGRDAFTFKSTDHDPPFRRRREQVSLLLNHRNATITIVHSRTKDAKAVVKQADIVIAAVGRAHMVKEDWLKDGAVVIDVGINSVDAPGTKKGLTRRGPFSAIMTAVLAIEFNPPMPEPISTPVRS